MAKSRTRAKADKAESVGRKNLIINGAMQVAQRGTTATAIASNKYTTCDRFLQEHTSGSWSVTSTQEADGPAPFTHSLKLEATSGASLGASEYMIPFEYRVEGYDFSRLGYNTTEAREVTLSFWIKSNRTGTNTVDFTLQGGGTNPFIARQYTINAADTWEHKTVVIPGNTSCTSLQTGGTNAVSIFWWNAAGSNFNSGAIASSWGVQTSANRAVGTTSTVSTGDYWQMTGVQLELGSVATPFEHRSYGEELALCQRYVWVPHRTGEGTFTLCGSVSSQIYREPLNFPVTMRATPSATYGTIMNGSGATFMSASISPQNKTQCMILSTSSTTTARLSTNSTLIFDAEL